MIARRVGDEGGGGNDVQSTCCSVALFGGGVLSPGDSPSMLGVKGFGSDSGATRWGVQEGELGVERRRDDMSPA